MRYLGQGDFLMSDSFPGQDRNKLCLSSKVPLGVVLCIPPFNCESLPRSQLPFAFVLVCRVAVCPVRHAVVSGKHMRAIVGARFRGKQLIDIAVGPIADPVNLAVSKIGPALMAGNTVVVKPPTQGAVSAIQMVQVGHSRPYVRIRPDVAISASSCQHGNSKCGA